jgi:hypothetical protein
MQNPVMRPAITGPRENQIRVAGKVPVGKEKQFNGLAKFVLFTGVYRPIFGSE